MTITRDNFEVLYDDASRFVREKTQAGLPFRCDIDPNEGLSLLMDFLTKVSDDVVLYFDYDDESGRPFHLYECERLSNGYTGYHLPLWQTYERMSPEFGLLVRRFMRTILAAAGLDDFDCSPMEYLRDWIECCAEERMNEEDMDEKEEAEELLSYYSDEPGTIGAKLKEFRTLDFLTAEELLAYIPRGQAEKSLHDLLVSHSPYLENPAQNRMDILRYAEFEGDESIDDIKDEVDGFIMMGMYFGVLWSVDDFDPVNTFLVQWFNDCFSSGTEPQELVCYREIGSPGPGLAEESAAVRGFISFTEQLTDALQSFPKE